MSILSRLFGSPPRPQSVKTPGVTANEYFADGKNWKPVVSSNLRWVAYFLSVQKGVPSKLAIRFKDGSEYRYTGVPLSVYTSLMSAGSKGRFAHQNIYWKYPTEGPL